MDRQLVDFHRPENVSSDRAASLVEYALLVALIAVVCIGAVSALGSAVDGSLDDANAGLTPASDINYSFCAAEDAVCTMSGTHTVRYGKNDTWTTRTMTGTFTCDNATFGDPLVGIRKECQVGDD